jgi:hypothetical protein
MTLDDAVAEVLGLLTGLDLEYAPELDRYQSITRQLNRALRANALEKEWSYYSDFETVGQSSEGLREVMLTSSVRPRVINDDAVRLVNSDGDTVRWAYYLPRDAIHKYPKRGGLWVSYTRNILTFSRPLRLAEAGYDIQVPVMREPKMFRLPQQPENEEEDLVEVSDAIRGQLVDFAYPDLITLRAAYYYAQTDPVMQPRVQTLEAQFKDLFYQISERDERMTDSPFLNEFFVPVQSGIYDNDLTPHWHPHSDERR